MDGRTMMHLYECENCKLMFGVQSYPEFDHAGVVCPSCCRKSYMTDVAYDIPIYYHDETMKKEIDRHV